jgi:hypothetical protein
MRTAMKTAKASPWRGPKPGDPANPNIPVPDSTEVLGKAADKLDSLVRSRQSVVAEIKTLEEQKIQFDGEILGLLARNQVKSVKVDDRWQATVAKGRAGVRTIDLELLRRAKVTEQQIGKAAVRVDGKLLLEAGVGSKVIQRATVEGEPGKPYLLVTDLTKETKET